MESGNGVSSSTGIFIPVPVNSDVFQNRILARLQSAYLFEESKHSFRYTSAFLIKNNLLEDRYNACREKRRKQGYSDTDLKETYGFLLFSELNKAKSIGETGVLAENGTCTTLGDPTKGVYLSMYSDSLDLNRWYHGKSGYIAIVKITQGRVQKVSENYTKNLTEPTAGFDCHVSELFPSVSSKTSSFLAFERTQYYLYELLDNGTTAQSPSLTCPYAVVEFEYTDSKGTLETQQEHLPPIIKVEWVISMFILRELLPKAIFETTLNGQVFREHIYCSLCEIAATSLEDKKQLTPLLLELKKQDVALIVALCHGGFLVLIHESNFISQDKDNGIATNKVLQGVFVFPESQLIQRDTKLERMKKRNLPSDALRALPLLIYAEGEVEKASNKPNQDLCDLIVQHMQSYATLISPGLPLSPFREVDIFPDQYDVVDAHHHLYSTPEWTDTHWQSLKSYLGNASSFQLPVSKAFEILGAGQEARQELEDDIYICLSSPEEPVSVISSGSEDTPDRKCSTSIGTSQDSKQPVSTISQLLDPSVLPAKEVSSQVLDSIVLTEKEDESSETSKMVERNEEPSEELIVSITSAAQTVDAEGLDVIKHDQLSVTAKLQEVTLNTFSEIVQSKMTLNCSDDNIYSAESDKLPQGHNLESTETPALQVDKTIFKKDESICLDHVPEKDLSVNVGRCELQRNKQESEQLSKDTQTEKTVETSFVDIALLKELESRTLKKKSERWGLKPVVTTCGQIFIPYGSVDIGEIRLLQEKLQPTKKNFDHAKEMSEVCDVSNNKLQMSNIDKKASTEPTEELTSISNGPTSVNAAQKANHEHTKGTDNLATEENHMKGSPTAKQSKGQIMLRKLKSVILKKRKIDALKGDSNINDVGDKELSPKKIKNDLTSVTISNINDKDIGDDVSNLPSVDPLFAQALGLTPKRWLHFQTPACYAEKQFQECLSDISVRKTIKEKTNTSSEALNLLADLALSTNKEQFSLHPAQQCEFETNWKKGDKTKDVISPEQQSVLHALLRQPSAKSVQQQEPPSPDCFGSSGLVDVICQEHAYSLPSSSFLPLALPAPFQVSPLNGSSTLLHAQRLNGGAPPTSPENTAEPNQTASGDPKRNWYRRKFCQSRTIENKDKSVCITRHWKEEYDFSLDSRFTVDPKDKTVVRALHGPWDSSIHDTNEEVQLIVHMWIGLFYSRSTDRFFHLDPDITFPAPDNSVLDGVDISNEKRPEQSSSNIVHSPVLNAADKPEGQALDLSQPKNFASDITPMCFSLPQDSTSVEMADDNPKVTTQELIKTQVPEELKTLIPEELQPRLLSQWYLNMLQAPGISPNMNYVGIPLKQSGGVSSELFIPVWNGTTNPNLWTNNSQTPPLPSPKPCESQKEQTKNTPENLPEKPASPIRKRVSRKRRAAWLSAKKLSQESKDVHAKENVASSNTHEDVDGVEGNHLSEIKKKYMEKLKVASSHVIQNTDLSPPQNAAKFGKYFLLQKLLRANNIRETPNFQLPSELKRVGCQNPKLDTTCTEKGWLNQSQESPTFPTTKETACTENLSELRSFNIIGAAPLVEPKNLKTPSSGDLPASVSNLQKITQPAGQYVAKEDLSKSQAIDLRKQDAIAANPQIDSKKLFQHECGKTTESPLINANIIHKHLNNDAEPLVESKNLKIPVLEDSSASVASLQERIQPPRHDVAKDSLFKCQDMSLRKEDCKGLAQPECVKTILSLMKTNSIKYRHPNHDATSLVKSPNLKIPFLEDLASSVASLHKRIEPPGQDVAKDCLSKCQDMSMKEKGAMVDILPVDCNKGNQLESVKTTELPESNTNNITHKHPNNDAALLGESQNLKIPFLEDLPSSVASLQERIEPPGQDVAKGCLSKCQDMSMKEKGAMVDYLPVDYSKGDQHECAKTVGSPMSNTKNITHKHPNNDATSLVETQNLKIPFLEDFPSSMASLQERIEPSGQDVAKDCVSKCKDMSMKEKGAMVDYLPVDYSKGDQHECAKTVGSPMSNTKNITLKHPNCDAASLVESQNLKIPFLEDLPSSMASLQERIEPPGQDVAKDCVSKCQDMSMKEKGAVVDFLPVDCNKGDQRECVKTTGSPVSNTNNITHKHPNHDAASLVESQNLKIPFLEDVSANVPCSQELSHDMAKECLSKYQETSMKEGAVVNNLPTDCTSPHDYVESPVVKTIDIYRHTNDETENNSLSLEDKLSEQTSNEMYTRGFEDKEVASSDSSKVTPLPFKEDNTNYEMHIEAVAGTEINLPSDLGDSEPDDRCPTPTIDEQPFVYTSKPNLNLDVKDSDDVPQDLSKIKPTDETLVENGPKAFHCDSKTKDTTQSDIELRTYRTLKCLDEYLTILQNRSKQSLCSPKDLPNSSIYSKTLIYDSKVMQKNDDYPEIKKSEASQFVCSSPVNVQENILQLKQRHSTSDSLFVKGEDLSKVSKSNDVDVKEKPKFNKPSSSTSPVGTSSKTVMDQGYHNKRKATPDCNAMSKPGIRFSIKKTKRGGFFCNGPIFEAHDVNKSCAENLIPSKCKHVAQQEQQNIKLSEVVSPTTTPQPTESQKSSVVQGVKHNSCTLVTDNKMAAEDLFNHSTSFVDSKTNKITDDSLGTRGSLSCTVSNTNKKASSFLEKVSKRCMQADPTQSSMDRECLIFWDQMKQLLKRKQDQDTHGDQRNLQSSCPLTVQFSNLEEQDDVLDDTEIPLSFLRQKIAVDMSGMEVLRDTIQQSCSKPQPHGALEQPGVSAITSECTRLYRDIMNKICSQSRNASLLKDLHRTDADDSPAYCSNYFDFCSQMKKEMDDSFHNSLNSVVKKSCKVKNRFFLLVTSDDAFFNETKAYLEAEGHIAVQPSDFFSRESSTSPLLVIVRNEDIAEHIFEVPHLLELRKSLLVQFAGIDEPDDVVNLTYQELFIKGGFVMFDRAAVESLSPGNMNKVLEILQKLSQTGKWKWVLHYRDMRRLKENARLCPKAKEKTDLLNKCKEDGLLDILPYHECDLMSKQEPNYLQCLCHQQVQNISSRYPVFVTDSKTDNGFEKNGIMTVTVNSFLMGSLIKAIK
ncbi:hypothetical protein WMY93_023861 [Mugilogobius chulae]|uniref:DUF3715 domain-containing protein n=1 Tax=Mugilogobius chulae TaxID=88201 RepID=A0AAW0N5D9_9GOBI